jgi:Zn-dependent protease
MQRAVQGFRAGTVFGFPVYIENSALYLAPWLMFMALGQSSGHGLVGALIIFAVIIASVLAHELAHALTATGLGVAVRHISLTWFGGYAEFWVQPTRWRDAAIAFAGPAANLAIGAALLATTTNLPDPNTLELVSGLGDGADMIMVHPRDLSLIEHGLRSGAFINLALGLLNLVPALPLDGGHILRAVLATRMSWGRAGWIAAWAGIVIGAVAVAYAVWIESFTFLFFGLFVGGTAWFERRAMRYD